MSETPAETMRRAAALMRKRAEAATPGPWRTHDTHLPGTGGHTATVLSGEGSATDLRAWLPTMSDEPWSEARNAWDDATHVASWHPLVAVSVADLLEEIARQYDEPPCDSPAGVCNGCERREDFNDAHRLAAAYLGEATP